ncbi:MAG TPA: hypothetical protein VEZ90_08650 [Blastocatellia bacterium]|nr:hypothetical protein [Blastocatellia bacterium]
METATNLPKQKWHLREVLSSVGWLFPRNAISEDILTTVRFNAPPEALWRGILFYEEVSFPPPLILRLFLPHPVRTSGDKTRTGSTVLCVYSAGRLIKMITEVEPPNLVRFDVLEQRLGIEGCITTMSGSYQIRPGHDGSDVILRTCYRGHLRPRALWRPLERFLAHRVHRYILSGMSVKLDRLDSAKGETIAGVKGIE